ACFFVHYLPAHNSPLLVGYQVSQFDDLCFGFFHFLPLSVYFLKLTLQCPADWTFPILGQILKTCARPYPTVRISYGRVIHVFTDGASVLGHIHTPCSTSKNDGINLAYQLSLLPYPARQRKYDYIVFSQKITHLANRPEPRALALDKK